VTNPIDDQALDALFRTARTYNSWVEEVLPEQVFHDIYELAKWGPTSANMSPARFVWVASAEGKERLAKLSLPSNGDKVRKAPVTVIIGTDMDFPEKLPELFPHNPGAKDWFQDPAFRESSGFRNSSLQGAYLVIAARALGYQCGPMSGFDNAAVDEEFFSGTNIKSNFICSIGHGTEQNLFPRSPRLSFADANQVV
jgi:3-hydroxypropanoate dehydrogenase